MQRSSCKNRSDMVRKPSVMYSHRIHSWVQYSCLWCRKAASFRRFEVSKSLRGLAREWFDLITAAQGLCTCDTKQRVLVIGDVSLVSFYPQLFDTSHALHRVTRLLCSFMDPANETPRSNAEVYKGFSRCCLPCSPQRMVHQFVRRVPPCNKK